MPERHCAVPSVLASLASVFSGVVINLWIRMSKSYTSDLDAAHHRFFHKLGIDPETGSISKDRKFAGYPYVGARYGTDTDTECHKLLVVGLDSGKDKNPGGGPFRDRGEFKKAADDPKVNAHMAGTYFTALRYACPPDWGWRLVEAQQETCERLLKRRLGLVLTANPLQYIAFTNYYKWVTKGREDRAGEKDRMHFDRQAEIALFHEEVRVLQPDIVVFQSKRFAEPEFANTRRFVEGIAHCLVLVHPSNRKRGGRRPRSVVTPILCDVA